MGLKIIVPTDKTKLKKQIKVLQYQIEKDKRDNNQKDLAIHTEALKTLRGNM